MDPVTSAEPSTAAVPVTSAEPSTAARPVATEQAVRPGYRWRWPALLVILGGEVMDLLDSLVTVIAGPSVVRDLGGGDTTIQWLTAGYAVAMAAGLLVGGRLGDRYGRRRVFLVGMGGFVLASGLCAAALSPGMLLATRVAQGLLGALMLPQGLGMIRAMFPPTQMATAFGAFGPIMGVSSVGGPVLAGWLIDADLLGLGWRAVFAVNLPIGLLALLAGLRLLPTDTPDRRVGLDPAGALMAAAGMAGLVFALIEGRGYGWPPWCVALILAALALVVTFAIHQARRDARGRPTVVVPSVFGKRAFTGGLLVGLTLFAAISALSLVLTLYLQLGLGYTPTRAGLAGMPMAVGMVAGFGVAAGLQQRLGRTLMHVGLAVAAVGLLGLGAVAAAGSAAASAGAVAAWLGLAGVGTGMTMSPFFDLALSGVDDHESGSASGALTSIQQVGGAVGVASVGTLFLGRVEGLPVDRLGGFGQAAQASFAAAAALLALTWLLAFLLPRRSAHPFSGH